MSSYSLYLPFLLLVVCFEERKVRPRAGPSLRILLKAAWRWDAFCKKDKGRELLTLSPFFQTVPCPPRPCRTLAVALLAVVDMYGCDLVLPFFVFDARGICFTDESLDDSTTTFTCFVWR